MSLCIKPPTSFSKFVSVQKGSQHVVTIATTSFARPVMRRTQTCIGTKPRIYPDFKKPGTRSKSVHVSQIPSMDGVASSLDGTVFSEENKTRVLKQLSEMKPSVTSFFFKRTPVRRAGVCVSLCMVDKIPSILYTLRSQFVTTHKGEISFPGGVMDETDTDVTQTTLRELKEELGICQESVDMWGQLVPVPDRSGKTTVTATLAYIDTDMNKLEYNTKEVEVVFTLPISHLCDPRNHGYTRFDPMKSTSASANEIGPYLLPVFRSAGYHIWGLTAVLTDLALGVLVPDDYKSLYF